MASYTKLALSTVITPILTIFPFLTSHTSTSSKAGTYASFPSKTEFDDELQTNPNAFKLIERAQQLHLACVPYLSRPMLKVTLHHGGQRSRQKLHKLDDMITCLIICDPK